jgi:hypothetical protein
MYESGSNFHRYRKLERPDYDNAEWRDFLMVAYITPLILFGQYLARRYTTEYFTRKLKAKYSGEVLKLKVQKSTKGIFKIFFYIFMTLSGLYVYSDTNYQSPLMFGSGDHIRLYSDWPYNKLPKYLKLYYMAGMSYHVSDMINLLVHPAQSDFFEMLLHHYITIVLIVGSFMTNVWNSGINVMIQMDNSEILIGTLRCFLDIWHIGIIFPLFLVLVASWIYFRVFVFSLEVIWDGSLSTRWRFDNNLNHQT